MTSLPETYFISIGIFVCLAAIGVRRFRTPWGVPYLVALCTIAAWYFVEPIYFASKFERLNPEGVQDAFDSVAIFLITFGLAAPFLAKQLRPNRSTTDLSKAYVHAGRALVMIAGIWFVLLVYGIVRMQGDVLGALFPMDGRAAARMWSRAAGGGAGATGFIVSTASYIYVLTLAAFGVLLFFVPRGRYRTLAIILILISWPYAFLQGSRNIALAVVLPTIVSYFLFSRHTLRAKVVAGSIGLFVLEFAMRVVVHYRKIGFHDIQLSDVQETKHLGLNMASELVHCVSFIRDGVLEMSYGGRYLAELANTIPRAIWPSKPLIGIDYAIARGFASSDSGTGVFASISSGVIGQGVLNFGLIVGPIVAAILFATWVGILARFRAQDTPLRTSLFLIGIGLTFNLGRDITLLVLWPMVFGYIGVRVIEYRETRLNRATAKSAYQRRTVPAAPRPLRAVRSTPLNRSHPSRSYMQ